MSNAPPTKVDVRPIPDLPEYFLGRDRSVWSSKPIGRTPLNPRSGQATALRPVKTKRRNGGFTEVSFWQGGKCRRHSVDRLWQAVWGTAEVPA